MARIVQIAKEMVAISGSLPGSISGHCSSLEIRKAVKHSVTYLLNQLLLIISMRYNYKKCTRYILIGVSDLVQHLAGQS